MLGVSSQSSFRSGHPYGGPVWRRPARAVQRVATSGHQRTEARVIQDASRAIRSSSIPKNACGDSAAGKPAPRLPALQRHELRARGSGEPTGEGGRAAVGRDLARVVPMVDHERRHADALKRHVAERLAHGGMGHGHTGHEDEAVGTVAAEPRRDARGRDRAHAESHQPHRRRIVTAELRDEGADVDGVLATRPEGEEPFPGPIGRRVGERYHEPTTGQLLPSRHEKAGRVPREPDGRQVELPSPADEDDDRGDGLPRRPHRPRRSG